MASKKAKLPASNSIDTAPLIDEAAAIEKELAPWQGKIARLEMLRKTIRGITDDKTNEVHGTRFIALLGPRGNKTVVNYYALAKTIGFEKYAQFATASLETLGTAVPAGILAHFLRTEATGTRSLKFIEKGQVA